MTKKWTRKKNQNIKKTILQPTILKLKSQLLIKLERKKDKYKDSNEINTPQPINVDYNPPQPINIESGRNVTYERPFILIFLGKAILLIFYFLIFVLVSPFLLIGLIILILNPYYFIIAIFVIKLKGKLSEIGWAMGCAAVTTVYFLVGVLANIAIVIGFYRAPFIIYHLIYIPMKQDKKKFFTKYDNFFSFIPVMYLSLITFFFDIFVFIFCFLILFLTIHRLKSLFTRLGSMEYTDFLSTKMHAVFFNELYYFGYSWNFISQDIVEPYFDMLKNLD